MLLEFWRRSRRILRRRKLSLGLHAIAGHIVFSVYRVLKCEPFTNSQHLLIIFSRERPRAAGADGITAELLKGAEKPISKALHKVCGPREEFQLNGKKALSSHSTRAKDRQSECSSYRPISLLSVSEKVFAHILLARIQPLLDKCRRPQQSGFTAGRQCYFHSEKNYYFNSNSIFSK